MSARANECVIWSADVSSVRMLAHYLRQMPGLKFVKIDRLFLERRDPSVIADIQDRFGVMVFDDAKFAEIPTKVGSLLDLHLKYKPWMINCMAGNIGGKTMAELDGLKYFAEACAKVGTRSCGVTVLTSKGEEVVTAEYNGRTSEEQVLWYVNVLAEAGFTDVVCSPQEAKIIRKETAFDHIELNTPGVRLASSGSHDQARVSTPFSAIHSGANRLVIGRDLTVGSPKKAFTTITKEIERALPLAA